MSATAGWSLTSFTTQASRKELQALGITTELQGNAMAILGAALAVSGRGWPMFIPPKDLGHDQRSEYLTWELWDLQRVIRVGLNFRPTCQSWQL